jgi:hypothetical protein
MFIMVQSLEISRDFCVEHAGQVFTEEQARELWQQDWAR